MKVKVRMFVALALFTLALSGAALAQGYDQSVRATIPFSFYADGALQPAGTYDFAINAGTHSIAMSSAETASTWFLAGVPADGTTRAAGMLTFVANEAGVYVLQEVQGADFGVGFSVKRAAARSIRAQASQGTQTVIAQLR